jgi:CRISPR/Cas system-associated exonuclease Cas4 (RecB family)
MENESISLQGAKKQVKRHVGIDTVIRWQEVETDQLDLSKKLHLPSGHLSTSQVRKYLKCPRQYELRYVNKLTESIGAGLVMGRAFHKGLQDATFKKALDGEILPTDDVLDIYATAFQDEIDNSDVDWADDNPDETKDNGAEMLHKYYEEIGINTIPRLDSEGIPYAERNHTFEIVPGLKVKVVMDIIEENGIVRDYKTSKKSPSAKVIDETIQLPTYALAYRDMFGEKETAVGLDYAVNLKREKKVMRLETEGPIDDGRIERVKQTFVGVAQSISAGIFYPNEESNACGYCSFNQICKKIK